MDLREMSCEYEDGLIGSESCLTAGFGVSCIEAFGYFVSVRFCRYVTPTQPTNPILDTCRIMYYLH
jgi:hypothetical protein